MNIIIIGAGAAGLMAGKHLSAAGNQVTILEARDRVGGRIDSFMHHDIQCEGGAEFIHGNLAVTLDLLKEAGIKAVPVTGAFWHCWQNEWSQSEQLFVNEALVAKKLEELTEDITIVELLTREFSEDKHEGLRESLLSYIEGYYAADPQNFSALQFYREWQAEDEEQYRVSGGYGNMIRYLQTSIENLGGHVLTNTIIKTIQWSGGKVKASDDHGNRFEGDKIIVTIPLGVWQSTSDCILFEPSIPQKQEAAQRLGFGNVIKILLHFQQPFWLNDPLHKRLKANLNNLSFVISDEAIPTYWTQTPNSIPMLTGWLAGPAAKEFSSATDAAIIDQALTSLSFVFSIDKHILEGWLQWSKVINWPADPFTRGGYAYSSVGSTEARKQMSAPVESTLYFAGEGLYDGTETGTVEAALTSGIQVAEQVMADRQR